MNMRLGMHTDSEKTVETANMASLLGSELTTIPVKMAPLGDQSATFRMGPVHDEPVSQHVIRYQMPLETVINHPGFAGTK